MATDQKLTQLSAATVSNDTDLLYVVQGTTSRKITKQLLMASTLSVANAAQNTANSAASAAATAYGNAVAAQGDATQALSDAAAADANAEARVPKATVSAALPSPFKLEKPQNIGSFGSPISGNITIDPADATYDGVAVIYHQDATEPTISVTGGTARKFGGESYDTTNVNIIVIYWNGGTDVGYSYLPEQ